MNYLDIVLGIILLIGLWKGFSNGLFKELASLIAIVAAIYGATHFSNYAATIITNNVNIDPKYVQLLAFATTFIIIIIGISLLGKILTKIADTAALGFLNKLAGGIFGAVKLAFIVSAIWMFIKPINNGLQIIKDETIQSSILFDKVEAVAPAILPKLMAKFDEMKPKKDSPTEENEPITPRFPKTTDPTIEEPQSI